MIPSIAMKLTGASFLLALVIACGQPTAPAPLPAAVGASPPAAPPPVVAPAAPGSLPAPPPPTPPLPAAPVACTVDPPGGVTIATKRAHPRVLVGAQGVLVVHTTRARPRWDEDDRGNWDCTWADAVAQLGFPLGASPPRPIESPGDSRGGCGLLHPDPVALVRRGDEAAFVTCGDHPYSNWTCTLARPFAAGAAWTTLPNLANEATARAASFAYGGGTLFGAVATTDGRLMGYAAAEGQPPKRALLQPLRGAATPLVQATSAAQATVTLLTDEATVTELVMSPEAARVGEPTTVPRPSPGGLPFEIVAARDPAPTHLAGRTGAAAPWQPIAGLDPAATTFAPSVTASGAGHLLVWSEGTGDATRIRAARLTAAPLALAGPIADVSSTGREAGFASVDAFGGHAVVAWDEKNGDTWEIHVAELRCP